jgi:hypothetical protein
MNLRSCSFVAPALLACALMAAGQTSCPAGVKSVSYGMNDSGDTVEGSICVKVNFNALRYDVVLNHTVTVSNGPTLSLTPPPAGGGTPGPGDTAQKVHDDLVVDDGALKALMGNDDDTATNLKNALLRLQELVDASNAAFDSGGAAAVLAMMNNASITKARAAGNAARWQSADSWVTQLQALKDRATKLQSSNPSPDDAQSLTQYQTTIASDIAAAAPYLISGDKSTSFQSQQGLFLWWDLHMAGLNASSFTAQTYVECHIITNVSKSNAIKIGGFDNFPRFSSQSPTALSISGNVSTVTCTSPFAISAGVEISFLKSPTFGLVPSGTSGTNEFGITDAGGVNPMPVAMIHWRMKDFAGDKVGLYTSFGAAAHVQSSAAGGSAAEYLTGLSVGLSRAAFISAGWHLGKVSALNGGYTVGATVPSGVTSVPVTSSYRSGFGLAITFTKP